MSDFWVPIGVSSIVITALMLPFNESISEAVISPEGCVVAAELGVVTKPMPSGNCVASAGGMRLTKEAIRFNDGKRMSVQFLVAWTRR